MDKYLKQLYLNENSPTFLAGINSLFREAKKKFPNIKNEDVENFLARQNVYTLHKPNRYKFKTSKVVSAGLDCDWQIDLADMQKLKKYNQGYSYILTCIDVLSKYGWAVPVKSKHSSEVTKAFKKILASGRKPWRIFSDKGKEFINKDFQKLLRENGIKFIAVENPLTKAPNVERYNRTIKTRLYKYFTLKNTKRWLNILPKIVSNINTSVNRMHGLRPIDITHKNDQLVYKILYKNSQLVSKSKQLKIGDLVRITKYKGYFEKGYLPSRTGEIFVISNIIKRIPPVYKLKDLKNEDITAIFYKEELVRILT